MGEKCRKSPKVDIKRTKKKTTKVQKKDVFVQKWKCLIKNEIVLWSKKWWYEALFYHVVAWWFTFWSEWRFPLKKTSFSMVENDIPSIRKQFCNLGSYGMWCWHLFCCFLTVSAHLLPHPTHLPPLQKRPVQRHFKRCVAVWQQIFKNKIFVTWVFGVTSWDLYDEIPDI